MLKQNGQIAIILLLFMLVALTIGLAATQRSLTNITTSSQTEQSSRAFSAAEAGLQRSIAAVDPIGPLNAVPAVLESELGNGANATVNTVNNLPRPNEALEYPPIGRDVIAQIWLADPTNQTSVWDKVNGDLVNHRYAYRSGSVDVYWGNGNPVSNPQPAIEINYVFQTAPNVYSSKRFFFDNVPGPGRLGSNNFTSLNPGDCGGLPIHTSFSVDSTALDRSFHCHKSIPIAAAETPILLRIRILYSNGKEPIAVFPIGGCGANCSLPPQAAIYTARGYSGQSQKTLQVFRQPFYLSPLLDFALFSPALISK